MDKSTPDNNPLGTQHEATPYCAAVIKCPTCGAAEMSRVNDDTYVCSHCNATIKLIKPEPDVNVHNEIHIHQSAPPTEDGSADIINYYCKPTLSEKDFLRSALVKLASISDVDEGVFDGEIAEVKTTVKSFALVNADYELNYTVSIGYNRKENYVEYEDKLVTTPNGSHYEKVPVNKTRTVTDWHPTAGTYRQNDVTTTVAATEHNPSEVERFEEFLSKASDDIIVPCTGGMQNDAFVPNALTDEQYERALELGQDEVEAECIDSLPGDVNKGFFAQCLRTTNCVMQYAVKQYELDYKCDGAAYRAFSFASEDNVQVTYPINFAKITAEVDKTTDKLGWCTLVFEVIFMILCIVLLAFGFNTEIINFAAVLPTFAVILIVYLLYEYKRKEAKNAAVAIARKHIKNALERLLEKYELAALTDREINDLFGEVRK